LLGASRRFNGWIYPNNLDDVKRCNQNNWAKKKPGTMAGLVGSMSGLSARHPA
jgi:hypothetical protein